jgi:hypothetical protein
MARAPSDDELRELQRQLNKGKRVLNKFLTANTANGRRSTFEALKEIADELEAAVDAREDEDDE